jgi:hypothetical protein
MQQLLKDIKDNKLLWLLAFVPAVFAAQAFTHDAHTLLFILSVLAIVPLTVLLSHATESVAAKTGDSVGGLLSATLGNLAELIIALAGPLVNVVIALTFVVPVLMLPLEEAMTVSVGWGLTLLAVLSYFLAQAQQIPAWKVIAEHVVIGVSVIAIIHYVGDRIHSTLS